MSRVSVIPCLFRRRERLTLTLWGWLLSFLLVAGLVVVVVRGLFPFLAISSPASAETLVVEGWIWEHSLESVVKKFGASGYKNAIVVNAVFAEGNKWESGRYRGEYLTNALARYGMPIERLALVQCDVVQKDRTYHSALALKAWLQAQGELPEALDVVTIGSHARRSRLLFEKAFGADTRIGVIALEERGYDPVHWWRSSEGVREVLFEGVAYLYVRFFFTGSGPGV